MGLRKRPYSEEKGGKRSAPKSSSGAAKSGGKSRFSKEDRPSSGAKKSSYGDAPAKRSFKRSEGEDRRPSRFSGDSSERRTPAKRTYTKRSDDGGESRDRRPSTRSYGKRTEGGSEDRRPSRFGSDRGDRRPSTRGGSYDRSSRFDREEDNDRRPTRSTGKSGRPYMVKGAKARDIKAKSEEMMESIAPEIVRLNRYISNAGICSRREADDLIAAGLVSVNGEIVTEMGYKVAPGDEIRYNNERLSWEKKVYLLMNKPKDTITSSDDPEGRKIIMDLIKDPRLPRVYPVGRLDRNTTGVILLTNDGELAQRLTHPKYNVVKIYKATLNKNFAPKDLQELSNNGVELEDGPIKPDAVGIPSASEKNVVWVQIHSGRNRIIHRMFEAMGYLVDKLDRLEFAGMERKGLDRGEWRHLDDKEIKKLKKLVQMK